jgi:photosystem II stability/assembly factor-like uncharacterized protein
MKFCQAEVFNILCQATYRPEFILCERPCPIKLQRKNFLSSMSRRFLTLILIFLAVGGTARSVFSQRLHWQPVAYPAVSPVGLSVAPHGDIYLASAGEYGYQPSAIYRSSDHGEHWHFQSGFYGGMRFSGLWTLTDSVLLTTVIRKDYGSYDTTEGIWRSADAGRHWLRLSQTPPASLAVIPTGLIFMQSYDSLYASLDQGSSWLHISAPNQLALGYHSRMLSVHGDELAIVWDSVVYLLQGLSQWRAVLPLGGKMFDPKYFFALPDGSMAVSTGDSLFVSKDDGATWNLSDLRAYDPFCFFRNGTVLAGNKMTTDRGKTWTEIQPATIQTYQYRIGGPATGNFGGVIVDSADFGFFPGQNSLLRLSNTSINPIASEPSNVNFQTIVADDFGGLTIQNSWRTSDYGAHWLPLMPRADGHFWSFWAGSHPRIGLVAANRYDDPPVGWYYLMHSSDGISWGETSHLLSTVQPTFLGFDREGNLYAKAATDLFYTADLGLSWDSWKLSLTLVGPYSTIVSLPKGSIILGGKEGIAISSDMGHAWKVVASNIPKESFTTVSCDSAGIILACSDSGSVIRSDDAGSTWRSFRVGLPADSAVRSVAYSSEGFWLAATGAGLFILRDGDSIWHAENDGLEDLNILTVAVGGPGKYYLGTAYNGIYTTTAPQSAVRRSSSLGSSIASRVYPNPARDKTTLEFDLPHSGECQIGLFDCMGREIQVVYHSTLEQGAHDIQIETTQLTAGTYFFRTRLGASSITTPFIIER